jgi:G3E family GTPase
VRIVNDDARLPLTLLTGFLGSGKTTLLGRLLEQPAFGDTAVIINELGDIGLDHLLVDRVDENFSVLASGCICCTVRSDLVDTLQALLARRARREIAFARVVVETTGLADPAPVLHTLMAEPAVLSAFRLDAVVTTVDAVNGAATLERHAEAVKQAAMADVLLLTKTDLASAEQANELTARLRRLNPGAAPRCVLHGAVDAKLVLGGAAHDGWPDAQPCCGHHAAHHHHHDDDHIRAHSFTFDAPVRETAFAHWLELLAAMRGERLLRVKGLVHVIERPDEPLLVQGAQHVFHPPQHLRAWPSDDHRTRLVFITQDLERAEIERTFHKFALKETFA